MNAVAIFVGLLFWGWVWNVWGMLLAVPMLMVLKAVGDHVEDFKPIGELLGDSDERAEVEPAAPGEQRLPEIAELRDARRHVLHREVLDPDAALDFLPGHRRRHGGLRPRPD